MDRPFNSQISRASYSYMKNGGFITQPRIPRRGDIGSSLDKRLQNKKAPKTPITL